MTELTCSAKFSKTVLFVCNLIVFIAGIVLLGVGIWFVSTPTSVHLLPVSGDDAYYGLIRAAGAIVIPVGVLLAIVGVLGCWGAIGNRTGCLGCFQVFLIIFIVLEIIAAVLVGVFHSQIMNDLSQNMKKTLDNSYGQSGKDSITKAWDFLQYEFSCCGVKDHTDWLNSTWKVNNATDNAVVPASCCNLNSSDWSKPVEKDKAECNREAKMEKQNYRELHGTGCDTKFENWFTGYWGLLIGIVIAIIFIEVTGIVLSCCLVAGIKRGYEYV